MKGALGKVLYGALFAVVLPVLLCVWARATAGVVRIPVPRSLPAGATLAGCGALLMVSGWYALYRHGGGLPMNAFRRPRHVTRGPYALVGHPIYVGFCGICFGVSLAVGSSSGFWLASPAMVLASAALVLGYEGPDLRARFGATAARPWLSLAPDEPSLPALAERLAVYPMVILLWCAVYQAIAIAGPPPDAVSTRLAVDDLIPVWERSEAVYALTYPLVLAGPLVAATRRDLRAFAVRGLLAMALIFPLYLALPLVSPPRPFEPEGALGALLAQERAWDTPACAFPSFHVVWAFIAARAWSSRFPRARVAFTALAVLIALSCLTTGMHSVADVAAGGVATLLVERHATVWGALRRAAERIANSWRERRVGPVRFINHGGWAALAMFGGIAVVGTLIGPGHSLSIVGAAAAGLVCAALWAQIVEGSPALLRPYGFYGGLLGATLGSLAAPLTGTSVWLLLAACCVAGPWVQAVGRCAAWCRAVATDTRRRRPSASATPTRDHGRAGSRVSEACRSIRRRSTPSSGTWSWRSSWAASGACTRRCISSEACTSGWVGSGASSRRRTAGSHRRRWLRGCGSTSGWRWAR